MSPKYEAGMFIIVSDLLGTLVFAGIFALTHNVYMATGIGIGLGVAQMAWELSRGRPVATMQWLSLALVILFGGVTLLTHNPIFIEVKPALIYAAVGTAMLKPGWMTRYMPAMVTETAPEIPRAFGFVWAGLMFVTALATLVFAWRFDTRIYALFLGVFPVSSKLALFGVQYLTTRLLVRRRVRALARAAQPDASEPSTERHDRSGPTPAPLHHASRGPPPQGGRNYSSAPKA